MDYVKRRVFPGGCLFVRAAAEPAAARAWCTTRSPPTSATGATCCSTRPRSAYERGKIDGDPAQLAFEIGALLAGASLLAVLHEDDTACDRAGAVVRARLGTE
ncbi:TetR family transcriptional regulator C-terminal domain-containing protein [Kribbella sp. NBC_01510]|uniref:TetR family transcriptional regulator C-terminal domain-containing protein n=1 Tax=Kribbella sp. NBC_01510 TaxID=2903581 RepID=UPI00386F726E